MGSMTLTEREQNLLLRALDKASAAAEADKAAQALIASLRKRGVSGYDFLDRSKGTHTPPPKPASPPPPPTPPPTQKPTSDSQKQTDNSYWRSGRRKNTERQRPQYFDFSMPERPRENYKKPIISREFSVDLFTVVATPLAVLGGATLLFFATALAIGSPLLGFPLLAFVIFRLLALCGVFQSSDRQNGINDERRDRG